METHESESTKSSPKRPSITLTGSGHLCVAIWKNKTDAGFDQYSIRLDKSYKDTDGTYKTTAYVNDQDLRRIEELYRQADERIEQDKQRQRGVSTASRADPLNKSHFASVRQLAYPLRIRLTLPGLIRDQQVTCLGR